MCFKIWILRCAQNDKAAGFKNLTKLSSIIITQNNAIL